MSTSRVAINTIVGTLSRVAVMILGFVVTPFLFHALGERQFGLYAVVGSLQAYYGVLDLGIGGSLVRYMAHYSEREEYDEVRQIVTFGILFYVVLASVLFPLVYFFADDIVHALGIEPDLVEVSRRSILIVFLLWIAGNVSNVFASRLIAVQRIDIASLAGILGAVAFTGMIVALGQAYPSLDFVWVCAAVQLVVMTVVVYVRAARLPGGMFANPLLIAGARVKELLSFGTWTQINSVSALLNLEADKVVISRYLGVAEVASYQIGNRLALLNRALPLQLLGALLPDMTAKFSRGISQDELAEAYRSGLRALMITTLIITGFVVAAADDLVELWIGNAVPGAAAIAIALVVSYSINNLTGLGTISLKALGRPKYETYYAVLSAALNVGLTIALIPHYGLMGVVGGTIIGNVVGSAFFIVLFHRLIPIPWWSSTGRWLVRLLAITVVAGLLAAMILRGLDGWLVQSRSVLFLKITAAGLAYLAVFYWSGLALRFWTDTDRALFSKLFGKISAGLRRLTEALR